MMIRNGRSLERIGRNDLLRLAKLAADVEAGLFARHPHGAGRYVGRLVCRALCQGAALHYLDARNSVRTSTSGPSTPRATMAHSVPVEGNSGLRPSKFGRYPDDPPSFTGRRADLLGRSLDVPLDAEPATVLRDYFSAARTRSAKELAAKAVVLINPEQLAGKVVWPMASPSE
jgi:hypothetical protein